MKSEYKRIEEDGGMVVIKIRQKGVYRTAWSLFVNGEYKKTRIIPNKNKAIVQNFGYEAINFK